MLQDYEIAVIPAVVRGPDDFVLGYSDWDRLYLSEEVVRALLHSPDLLKEYLWHELTEDPEDGTSHYSAIAEAQKIFAKNYSDPAYVSGPEGFLIDPANGGKIAKGLLGKKLREVIDTVNRIQYGPYSSKEEAIQEYTRYYGEPDPVLWKQLQDANSSFGGLALNFFVQNYGIKGILDIRRAIGDGYYHEFVNHLDKMGSFWRRWENKDFRDYWPGIYEMAVAAGPNASSLLDWLYQSAGRGGLVDHFLF